MHIVFIRLQANSAILLTIILLFTLKNWFSKTKLPPTIHLYWDNICSLWATSVRMYPCSLGLPTSALVYSYKCPHPLALLLDTNNCGLRMGRDYRERFPCHRRQRKRLNSDTGMHHGTCVTHVPWCMSGSLTGSDEKNVPGIPGTCSNHSFTYLSKRPIDTILGNSGKYKSRV